MTRRSRSLPATRESPAAARALVRDAIVSAGIPVDVGDATVAVSEIVSNVVRHAGTPMRVDVVAGPFLRVEVTDSRPELPVPQPSPDGDGSWEVHGRGLRIVDVLAARWGQTQDAGSKTVWFELDPADLPSRASAIFRDEDRGTPSGR